MPQDFRSVDPRELRLPSGRSGPDPYKLQRQIALKILRRDVALGVAERAVGEAQALEGLGRGDLVD